MDLISVIIPYYKKEKFIKSTIKSILNQTYKKFEIIIINDEITEKSKILLKKISGLDKRIKIFKNSKNMGAGYSRNFGIKKSKGSFIAFCDSDDLWHRNKLQFQIGKMKRFNLKISSTNYKIIDENNNYLGLRKSFDNLTYKRLINSCDIGLSTVMVKRCLFEKKKYRFANLKTKEDYVLWLMITRDNIIIKNFNENLTFWRKCKESLSSSSIQKILDGYKVYRNYLNFNVVYSLYRLTVLSMNYLKKK